MSEPVDTASMRLERRISAVYKDIPGGQMLGPTYDYTHRLLDFTLLANGETPPLKTAERPPEATPHVLTCWCSRAGESGTGVPRPARRHHPQSAGLSLFSLVTPATAGARR